MERLSIDFKGPVPSVTSNTYLLVVIDEYLQFPFVFPCPNMHTTTIIKALDRLFSLTGMPSYIHSHRGTSFMPKELRDYLVQKGVATCKTTPNHPTGSAQVEQFNGTIWKMIQLSIRSWDLTEKYWKLILQEKLYSTRSLLCTSTNTTPTSTFLFILLPFITWYFLVNVTRACAIKKIRKKQQNQPLCGSGWTSE